ncbi:MAG: InlB B-repeat-containing protein [Clostridia bacterium]|nr:InlB B-repeat-containing protein [Clostridia bacterium]
MKNIKKIMFILMGICVFFAFGLSACGTKTYEVSIKVDGEIVSTQNVENAESLILPQADKVGYTLSWMIEDGAEFTENSDIKGNIVIYAKYTAKSFSINFENAGAQVDAISVKYDQENIELPEVPAKKGYNNGVWKLNGEAISSIAKWNYLDNITLTAEYTAMTYTLSFSDSEGEVAAISATYDKPLTNLPEITGKTGYDGVWEIDGEMITDSTVWNFDTDKTAAAVYTAKSFSINFENAGAQVDAISVKYDQENIELPEVPAKKGYNGVWKLNGEVIRSIAKWTYLNNITVRAEYTAKTYTLSFNDSEGEVAAISVTYKQAIANLPDTTGKAGYDSVWKIDGKEISSSTVWNFDMNKTAIAVYTLHVEKFSMSFSEPVTSITDRNAIYLRENVDIYGTTEATDWATLEVSGNSPKFNGETFAVTIQVSDCANDLYLTGFADAKDEDELFIPAGFSVSLTKGITPYIFTSSEDISFVYYGGIGWQLKDSVNIPETKLSVGFTGYYSGFNLAARFVSTRNIGDNSSLNVIGDSLFYDASAGTTTYKVLEFSSSSLPSILVKGFGTADAGDIVILKKGFKFIVGDTTYYLDSGWQLKYDGTNWSCAMYFEQEDIQDTLTFDGSTVGKKYIASNYAQLYTPADWAAQTSVGTMLYNGVKSNMVWKSVSISEGWNTELYSESLEPVEGDTITFEAGYGFVRNGILYRTAEDFVLIFTNGNWVKQ